MSMSSVGQGELRPETEPCGSAANSVTTHSLSGRTECQSDSQYRHACRQKKMDAAKNTLQSSQSSTSTQRIPFQDLSSGDQQPDAQQLEPFQISGFFFFVAEHGAPEGRKQA